MGSFGEVLSAIWGNISGNVGIMFAIFGVLGVLATYGIFQLIAWIKTMI